MYFSDPVTKKFLANEINEVFGFPQLVRFSWSTAGNALEGKSYHVDWEETEDTENPAAKNNTAITSFFQLYKHPSDSKMKSTKTKHKFFTERHLTSATQM